MIKAGVAELGTAGLGDARQGSSRFGMAGVAQRPDGPVEVWLTQRNLAVIGHLFYDDESGAALAVRSVSMRGARREVTSLLARDGYTPAGRWETAARNSAGTETTRRFRKENQ